MGTYLGTEGTHTDMLVTLFHQSDQPDPPEEDATEYTTEELRNLASIQEEQRDILDAIEATLGWLTRALFGRGNDGD